MSQFIILSDGTAGNEPTTMPFPAIDNGFEKPATGTFVTYGPAKNRDKGNKFILYIWREDGEFYQTFDVTSQIDSAPDKRNVHLIMKITQPEIPVNGGMPEVDKFIDEDHEIEI